MLRLGIYRHYKGSLYRVVAVARHTETKQPLAIYHGLDGEHRTWARPLDMFQSKVVIKDEPMDRFTLLHENPLECLPDYYQ